MARVKCGPSSWTAADACIGVELHSHVRFLSRWNWPVRWSMVARAHRVPEARGPCHPRCAAPGPGPGILCRGMQKGSRAFFRPLVKRRGDCVSLASRVKVGANGARPRSHRSIAQGPGRGSAIWPAQVESGVFRFAVFRQSHETGWPAAWIRNLHSRKPRDGSGGSYPARSRSSPPRRHSVRGRTSGRWFGRRF